MSTTKNTIVSIGERMAEERGRLGLSREDVALAAGMTPQGLGKAERGESATGADTLAAFAGLGADVQYILTGVHSANIYQVAEEVGVYKGGVGALSREEEKVVEVYRQLRPQDRSHARAIIDALASAVKTDGETG